MDYAAVERARERLEAAAEARTQQADVDAALDRARAQMFELGELAARLEAISLEVPWVGCYRIDAPKYHKIRPMPHFAKPGDGSWT